MAMEARKTGITPQANDTRALEAAAATRMLVAERILDYSGHVSIRIPGQDAFVIQIGSNSRAEVEPAAMLVLRRQRPGGRRPAAERNPDPHRNPESAAGRAGGAAFPHGTGDRLHHDGGHHAAADAGARFALEERHPDRSRSEPHQDPGAGPGAGQDAGSASRRADARARPHAGRGSRRRRCSSTPCISRRMRPRRCRRCRRAPSRCR